jgi:type I restriction enzyme S subunit
MNDWKKYKLAEVLFFYNGKEVISKDNDVFPVYGSNGIIGFHNESYFENAVIIGRVGAYCGSVFYDKGKFWASDNTIVVKEKDGFDIVFIFHLLSFLDLNRFAGGSAQPLLTHSYIKPIELKFPPLPIQKKIAAILSAYDDLIENNLKQIRLLEEMAQITYQEWFVRLQFPNHENTPIDETTGLPIGWEKRKIKDLCSDITDGTHETPKEVNEGIKLITGKHIDDGFINFETAYLISKEDHEQIKKRSGLNKGDILFSNIGTLGSIGVVTQDFEFSCKNVIIFKYKKGYSHFLYTYLANENTKNKLSAQSAGVAQKFYSLNFIRNFEDYLPTNELIELFDKKVSNSYALKYQLHQQNQLLKEARDILLPRLMTGKITVD